MTNLILFLCCSFGMTHIITRSTIFEPVRDFMQKKSEDFFGVLFTCPTCMGFWVGVFICLFLFQPIVLTNWLSSAFVSGCIASGFSTFTFAMLSLIDSKQELNEVQTIVAGLTVNDLESGKK